MACAGQERGQPCPRVGSSLSFARTGLSALRWRWASSRAYALKYLLQRRVRRGGFLLNRLQFLHNLERQIEADEFLVVLHQLERLRARADFLRDSVEFVVEHIAKSLGENERKDELLVFGRILRAANGTSGIPNPGFERFVRRFRHRHESSGASGGCKAAFD